MSFTKTTVSKFIQTLKDLSKKHHFETHFTIGLSQNQILLHLNSININLTNVPDYRELKFDTIKELQEDIDVLFTDDLQQHKGYCHVSACIPNAIVEPDPWEDYDNYYDYALFDHGYREDDAKPLVLEQTFDAKESILRQFRLTIDNGTAKLEYPLTEMSVYPFQYNLEIVDTLNQIMENPYQFVSSSELKDDADRLLKDINDVYKKKSKLNLAINKGQRVTHKTLTFNYLKESHNGQLTGLVYNTFYIAPDFNKLNKLKYKPITKNIPLYHNIIKYDMQLRTTFGYNYEPSLSPFVLRKMNDATNTYTQTLTKIFDSKNFAFSNMDQIYINITNPVTIDTVLVDLGRFYFLAQNDLVAQIECNVDKMALSYSDLKKQCYKDEIKKTVQDFITHATKD